MKSIFACPIFQDQCPVGVKPRAFASLFPHFIIIDGHVWLEPDRPGLGHHLYKALKESIPVIGVAKNSFKGSIVAENVIRGESRKPLYITSAGISSIQAAQFVKSMHGVHRMPTMIKLADQLSKNHIEKSL